MRIIAPFGILRRQEVCGSETLQDPGATAGAHLFVYNPALCLCSRHFVPEQSASCMHLHLRGNYSQGQGHTAGYACSRPCCYLRTHVPCSNRPKRRITASLLPKSSTKGSQYTGTCGNSPFQDPATALLAQREMYRGGHRALRLHAQKWQRGLCAHTAARTTFVGRLASQAGVLR